MTGARHWGDNGAQSRQNPAHSRVTDEVVWETDLGSPAFHFAKLGLKVRNQCPLILINTHFSLEENGYFNLQQRGGHPLQGPVYLNDRIRTTSHANLSGWHLAA